MNSGQTSDPTQTLTYLQATSSSIENLGSEQVGGVSTTHYHAVVEWDKAEQLMVARAPAAEKAAVRSTYEALKAQTGITSYPVDAWVDGNGLVRQMHMSIPVPTTGSESIDMTIRMSDFGAPVHVSAPPARLVEDFTKLAGR
jgi:hypothetical protein